jgi:hypothetical protein
MRLHDFVLLLVLATTAASENATAVASEKDGCHGGTRQLQECSVVDSFLINLGSDVKLCTGTRADIASAISGVGSNVTGDVHFPELDVAINYNDAILDYCVPDGDGGCKDKDKDGMIEIGTYFRSNRIQYGITTPCGHPLELHTPSNDGGTRLTVSNDCSEGVKFHLLQISLDAPAQIVLQCTHHENMTTLKINVKNYTLGIGKHPSGEYNGVPITAAVLCPELCNNCNKAADPTIRSTYKVPGGDCNATVAALLENRTRANVTSQWGDNFGNFGDANVNATCRVDKRRRRARQAQTTGDPLEYTVVVKLPSVAASGGAALLRGTAIGLDEARVMTSDIEAIANVTASTFQASLPAVATTTATTRGVATRLQTTSSSTADSDDSGGLSTEAIIAIAAVCVAALGTVIAELCVRPSLRTRLWNVLTSRADPGAPVELETERNNPKYATLLNH